MRIRLFILCLALSFGGSLAAQGQTYKIQLKEFPDPGKKVEEKFSEKTRESIKATVMGKVVKDETKERTEEKVTILETLQKGEGSPKKYQKTFTKATVTEDNKPKAMPHQGRTIVYELINGKYDIKPEGQPPLPEETLKKLATSANNNINGQMSKIMVPDKAVSVGDTWKIDMTRLARTMGAGLPVDADKSTGQGKLLKAYKKGNRQFGVIEYDLKLMVSSLGPNKLANPVPLNLLMTVDTAIDGSSTEGSMQSRGSLQGKTEIMQMGQTIVIDFNMQMSGRQEQSEEK